MSEIVSKPATDAYREGWERTFGYSEQIRQEIINDLLAKVRKAFDNCKKFKVNLPPTSRSR